MKIYIKKGDRSIKHGLWRECSVVFICLSMAFCLRLGELRRIKDQPPDLDVSSFITVLKEKARTFGARTRLILFHHPFRSLLSILLGIGLLSMQKGI